MITAMVANQRVRNAVTLSIIMIVFYIRFQNTGTVLQFVTVYIKQEIKHSEIASVNSDVAVPKFVMCNKQVDGVKYLSKQYPARPTVI